MTRLLKAPAFRLSLAFAAAVCVSAYVVSAIVYARIYTADVGLVRSLLEDEVKGARDEAPAVLEEHLKRRLTQDLRRLDYVGLYDATGRLVLGNMEAGLRIPLDGRSHFAQAPAPRAGADREEEAVFIGVPRKDGGSLVLGRTLAYVDQIGAAVLQGFALALIPVVAVAIAGGVLASRLSWRRLSAIKFAIECVIRGEVHVRLPVGRRSGDVNDLVIAVNRMLDEIVRLLSQIKNVGDNIAHDLRAPLAVVRVKLERSLSSGTMDELRDIVGDTLEDLDRASASVSALLRISELEGTARRQRFATVDFTAVCRHTFDLFEPLAEDKGIVMRFEPHPATVAGDDDLLHEAVANLVDNAIKYTPTGGRVVLSCGGPDSLVRISDNGPGIAPADRSKVLDRYYRAEGTNEAPGAGLGLSMTKTILDQHGLSLRILDNDPGAAFEIYEEAPSTPAADNGTVIPPASRTILRMTRRARNPGSPAGTNRSWPDGGASKSRDHADGGCCLPAQPLGEATGVFRGVAPALRARRVRGWDSLEALQLAPDQPAGSPENVGRALHCASPPNHVATRHRFDAGGYAAIQYTSVLL